MVNVLYLSYDGMTDQLGQSQVLPYLVGLSKLGYSFHLISFEKKEHYAKSKNIIEQICAEAKVTWHPLVYHKWPPIISTWYDLQLLKQKCFQLHRLHQFKIVHCRSYITPFAGQALKKKFGVKFIFDMRGFYADERVDGGIWNQRNPIFKAVYNYFKHAEKKFLHDADHIISLTSRAEKIIQSWQLKSQPLPITVIPCCADLNLFHYQAVSEEQKSLLKNTLGIANETKVVIYLGAIGTWYMLNEMLDFFKSFKQTYANAKMLFVTNDNAEVIMTNSKNKNIASSDIVITSVPRAQVPVHIAISDVALFFIKPVFSKSASSPTKQGEIMGMGVPIICNSGIGDTDEIIRHTNSGILIASFESAQYEQAVKAVAATIFSKEEIRQGAQTYYALDMGVSRYHAVYKAMIN